MRARTSWIGRNLTPAVAAGAAAESLVTSRERERGTLGEVSEKGTGFVGSAGDMRSVACRAAMAERGSATSCGLVGSSSVVRKTRPSSSPSPSSPIGRRWCASMLHSGATSQRASSRAFAHTPTPAALTCGAQWATKDCRQHSRRVGRPSWSGSARRESCRPGSLRVGSFLDAD
ncbi:hypothetical protein BKA80DRAFT_286673 [Phyllosticta citrichinensis]